MSTSTPNKFIAFFGATGGCANACLVHTLNAGLHASALARTPSKLTEMLLAQGISQAVMDAQLNIVQGDIADLSAIKDVLLSGSRRRDTPLLASEIISGIESNLQMQWSVKRPVTVDNREICATSAKNIMQALQETYLEYPSTAQRRPSIVVISTTGASDTNEDVPFAFRFLYDILLADASKDKKDMERLVMGNTVDSDVAQPVFRGAVALRPSLLVGDQNIKDGKGWQTLKVGLQDSPAVGFTVHRADVGEWIYEQIIKRGDERWFGQLVTLTS